MQKDVFLSGEGNAWYRRNKSNLDNLNQHNDSVCEFIHQQNLLPTSVLEIGCASGERLNAINQQFSADCCGIDVSNEAVNSGSEKFKQLSLTAGSADSLPYKDESFDLVIFGFCLYLCDRKDLFKIAYEADRVLKDNGMIIIKDFHPPFPFKNTYSHCENIYSYKMNYSQLFTWNPAYTLLSSNILGHDLTADRKDVDERISLCLLYKDLEGGYPANPK